MSTSESVPLVEPTVDASRHNALRPSPPAGRFSAHHPSDRNFFLVYVALIWAGVLGGFVPDIIKHVRTHAPSYPWIIHVHAVVFGSWLLLLTTQILLIRSGRLTLHRHLGGAGAILAALMIVVGPAAAVITDQLRIERGVGDPTFLVVQIADMVAFAGLIVPALIWRSDRSAHKRLILLATLYIADAGFARLQYGTLAPLFGGGFWSKTVGLYFGNDLLIVGIGLYDLVTRRRLHRAYVAGVAWVALVQLTAMLIYQDPRWKPVALWLLGH